MTREHVLQRKKITFNTPYTNKQITEKVTPKIAHNIIITQHIKTWF